MLALYTLSQRSRECRSRYGQGERSVDTSNRRESKKGPQQRDCLGAKGSSGPVTALTMGLQLWDVNTGNSLGKQTNKQKLYVELQKTTCFYKTRA